MEGSLGKGGHDRPIDRGHDVNFNNLGISRKLALAFAALVATIFAMSVAINMNLRAFGEAEEAEFQATSGLGASMLADYRLVRQENSLRGFLMTSDDFYLERLNGHRAVFDEQVELMRQAYAGHDQIYSALDSIEAGMNEWNASIVEEAQRLVSEPFTRRQASDLIERDGLSDQYIEAIEASLTEIRQFATASREEALATAERAERGTQIALYAGVGAALAIAIGLGYLLSRAIATPINGLTNVMGRLAAGDNDIEVPATKRGDEVGAMARAVLVFKEAAIEKIRLEEQAAQERAANEDERQRRDAEKAREAKEDHIAISNVAEALAALAGGDLTHRIEVEFAPKTQKLKDDFNATAGRLEEAMARINSAIGGIHSGTGEISQAADDLSRRTEQQAASLEETAAALDEITATVKKTADGAQEAAGVTDEARTGAEHSGEVVRNAIAAMSQIEKSSHEIGQIIGVIDEIAFQTNLLALNAGVEAARAGDAGRGFAVVASEVRALAQRSAEAAKEIRELISTSGQQVGQGVELVSQTSQALERIVSQVSQITGLVGEIAASAQEQATGLSQVNSAVNQMDQVTQQNAAMVEQSTAASHGLAREAQELTQLVSLFKTSAKSEATVSDTGKQSVAASSATRTAARPVTQLKSVATSGGRAAALLAEDQDDDWEEF